LQIIERLIILVDAMLRLISQTLLSLLFIALAIYIVVLYVQQRESAGSLFLLLIAAFILGLGGFFLSNAWLPIIKRKKEKPIVVPAPSTSTNSTLQKNNDLTEQWAKTNEQQARLKLLEISTDAEK